MRTLSNYKNKQEDIMEQGVKISLKTPSDFLLVKESLTRIGVVSNKTKTLYQSAHVLHKQGNYYIIHFKELFLLDGKTSNISEEDYGRRNLIAKLLQDWGLLAVLEPEKIEKQAPLSSIKILNFKEKDNWVLTAK